MTATRSGNKWNTNELLSLQREYELLEMTIQEIAVKHKRTIEAILYRLYNEQIIGEQEVARGYSKYAEQQFGTSFTNELMEPSIDYNSIEDETNDVISDIHKRVSNLESAMNDVQYLLQQLVTFSTKKTKRAPLRQQLSASY
jgi:prefoldin subunit 5